MPGDGWSLTLPSLTSRSSTLIGHERTRSRNLPTTVTTCLTEPLSVEEALNVACVLVVLGWPQCLAQSQPIRSVAWLHRPHLESYGPSLRHCSVAVCSGIRARHAPILPVEGINSGLPARPCIPRPQVASKGAPHREPPRCGSGNVLRRDAAIPWLKRQRRCAGGGAPQQPQTRCGPQGGLSIEIHFPLMPFAMPRQAASETLGRPA